jgi:hypothetical protein
MGEKLRSKKKFIILLSILTVVIIIAGLGISRLKDESITEKKRNLNYIITQNEVKENNSDQVKEEQKINNLVISNTKIVYEYEISTLTADIINTSTDINNLKMKVIFLDDDSKIIAEKEFNAFDIKENETKNISLELPEDVSNSKSVKYEIVI